jgi:hypothetical protein
MNDITTVIVSLVCGAGGAVGGAWLLKSFLGKGIEHFFSIALKNRDIVGTSELEFRKQQLSELYGPIYAYGKLNSRLYSIWMSGKLQDINVEIIALFRRQNERIMEILSTKMHLLDGDALPQGFTHFMTSVTLWNIYTARHDQPWVPKEVADLPDAKYPEEFEQYIFDTTQRLKRRVDELHKKYGIT